MSILPFDSGRAKLRGQLRETAISAREAEVLDCLPLGNAEIAELLGISVSTVEKHISHACDKLGAGNRTAAALIWARRGKAAA